MSLKKLPACPPFDVDSEQCPQALKLVLREHIRQVFTLRSEFETYVLSNLGLDTYIDLWWKNHRNIIRAASIRPEWDFGTLSLRFDENVMRPVNFYRAQRDYLILLCRPYYLDRFLALDWDFNLNVPIIPLPSSDFYLGDAHAFLYPLFVNLFQKVILEDKSTSVDSVYTDVDAKLSKDKCESIQTFINEHTEQEDKRSVFSRRFSEMFETDFIPFNKIPKFIFEYALNHRVYGYEDKFKAIRDFISRNLDYFYADIYKSIGAHQLSGDVGPVKTTLTNKLLKIFYDWLTALTIGYAGNPFEITDDQTFEFYVNKMKNDFTFYSDEQFKIRDLQNGGFRFVNVGTYEQLFARLQENVRGTTSRESFIVSFHPCDMITCSLGYNWSSCQSFVNKFNDFPTGYGYGNNYGGTYNRGNFQFSCGNGFIAYVPYEKLNDRQQYLWAKKKRCLLWVSNELNCMRQNFFYPGRPEDQETLAFAKVIREYIQNICAPFNFSNGTIDWKSCSKRVRHLSELNDSDFTKFTEETTFNSGRYDDPILTASYLKGIENGKLIYAHDFPTFDTGRLGNSFFKRTYNVCPVCGKQHSHEGMCDHCLAECIDHNGKKVHPSNLLKVVVDGETKYFDYTELDILNEYVAVEDGTHVPFKSAFKVFMPSGIKYFKALPDYVKQCKVCKEYFHPSFMVGDVCIEHINTVLDDNLDIEIDFDVVLQSFLNSTLSFACNDTEALTKLLNILNDKDVKWQSGKNPSEYIPSSRISLGRFLSCDNKKLIVSSQAKSTVVKLSKLFKKGGE